jgi:hypothetical protein
MEVEVIARVVRRRTGGANQMCNLTNGPAPVEDGRSSSFKSKFKAEIEEGSADLLDARRIRLADKWRGGVEEEGSS